MGSEELSNKLLFRENPQAWALWRLSLVLRDIAVAADQDRRRYKGDRWTRVYGSRIPTGAIVRVVKFYPRRRVLIEYNGESILTMLWCLKKLI